MVSIAGTMPDNGPPCIPLADEVCYMNILDPDEVESKTAIYDLTAWQLVAWIVA